MASLRDWLMPDGQLISRNAMMMSNPPRPPRPIMQPAVPRAVLMDKLQAAGFNKAQAAALVGNMQVESSFIPNNVNDKEGAHGLIQWRDERGGRGGRFTDLQNYAAKQGSHWSDVDTQIGFIKHEMSGKERQNAARFMNASTVEEANAGLRRYIRYGAQNEGKRLANARGALGEPSNPAAANAYVNQQPSKVANAPAVKAVQAAVKDPAVVAQAKPQRASAVQAAQAPAAQTRLRVSPAARSAGDVAAGAALGPSQPSDLARGVMRQYGPEGARNLSTYVEPATGNEILTGSVGGESIYKNLGKTGAGTQPKPAALQTAVKQAVAPAPAPAEPQVPLPRPRPDEAPRDLGQRFRPMPDEVPPPDEVTHRGVDPARGDQNVSIFNMNPDWRLRGYAPPMPDHNIPGPSALVPGFTPAPPAAGIGGAGGPATFPGPRGSPALPVLPPSPPPQQAPATPGPAVPGPSVPMSMMQPPPFLQWWQQQQGMPGYAFGGGGFGGGFAGLGGGGFEGFGGGFGGVG